MEKNNKIRAIGFANIFFIKGTTLYTFIEVCKLQPVALTHSFTHTSYFLGYVQNSLINCLSYLRHFPGETLAIGTERVYLSGEHRSLDLVQITTLLRSIVFNGHKDKDKYKENRALGGA